MSGPSLLIESTDSINRLYDIYIMYIPNRGCTLHVCDHAQKRACPEKITAHTHMANHGDTSASMHNTRTFYLVSIE